MAIQLEFPPFPEGEEMTTSEFLAWLSENAVITQDGEDLGGQIGGDRPTENSGLYVNGRDIEVWDEDLSKYVTATSVPVGALVPWAGASAVIPDNYLLCDGRVVLDEDYPELATVLGTTYDESGDPAGSFRLPDLRGRLIMGAGTGEYKDEEKSLPPRTIGSYVGQHWPKNVAPWANAPSSANKWIEATAFNSANTTKTAEMTQPAVVMQWIIRYR